MISKQDPERALTSWVTFLGCVLVVAVLYWTQVLLVPIALASLLAFILVPVVTRVQRWMGGALRQSSWSSRWASPFSASPPGGR